MSPTKIILWILAAAVTIFAICEGTYQLLGNGLIARLVCTAALIAAAPLFVKPFIYREPGARPDPMADRLKLEEEERDDNEEV